MRFKKLYSVASVGLLAAPIVALVSCGSNQAGQNEWKNSKTIVIAVDGVQKKMYDDVLSQFNKSSFHHDGFKIKFIEKDVFGAIDLATTLGYTDSNVPDLIYAPQDRVTALIQQKAAMPWTTQMRDSFLTKLGATEQEKTWAKGYGSLNINGQQTFFAMPHNKEGITLIAKKTAQEVATDLSGTTLNTLQKMVDSGEGIFRIQDFWYGNGILGGVFGANAPELAKLLYKDENSGKWNSGFLKKNASYHAKFERAERLAADLWYTPWKAAYGDGYSKDIGHYQSHGILKSDLQAIVNSNVAAAQNKIFELMHDGKLKYALAGTWDLQNAANKGVNTYLNVPKLDDKTSYVQAPGSWSYVINARNNGASQARIGAIMEVLNQIYSKQGFYDYFQSDSKVPLFDSRKQGVEDFSKKDGGQILQKITAIATAYKQTDPQLFISTFNTKFAEVDKTLRGLNVIDDYSNGAIIAKPDLAKLPVATIFPGLANQATLLAQYAKIKAGSAFVSYTGIRDAVAAISGVALNNLVGSDGTTKWQVNKTLYKNNGVGIDKAASISAQDFHVRKLGKLIFGVDGNNKEDQKALIARIIKESYAKVRAEVYTKALQFATDFAKVTVSDADIAKYVDAYLGNYRNQAKVVQFVEGYRAALKAIKYNGGTYSIATILNLVNQYSKSQIFNAIFNVVTSDAKFDANDSKKLGKMAYQTKRFDHYNPQFSGVWALWNEQTFGSLIWLKQLPKTATKAQFEQSVVDRLDQMYQQKTAVLDATEQTDYIIFDD